MISAIFGLLLFAADPPQYALTNAQLRASPVIVTFGTQNVTVSSVAGVVVVAGPLTDAQLRAKPIHVLVDTPIIALPGLTDDQLRATPVPVTISGGSGAGLTDAQLRATPVPISGTLHAIIDSGVVTSITNPVAVTGTFWQATQPVSQTTGTNLHAVIDSGSTTAVTALPVGHNIIDSGTVTAVTAITNALPAGSNVIGHVISDSGSTTVVTGTTTVAGTVTANAGTNLNTSALQLDATGAALNLGQASTTSGQTGPLAQTATTTAAPTYVTAKTNPLSTTTAGALRVDGSGVTQPVSGTFFQATQPVSGTVTANAGTNLNTSALALDATLTGGTTKAISRGGAKGATTAADVTSTANGADHNGLDVTLMPSTNVVGHVINDASSAVIGHVINDASSAVIGHVINDSGSTTVVTGTTTISGTVTANAGTNLNTSSLQLDATGAALNLSQASTTSGQTGPLAQTATTTAAPTYVTGKTNPLSTTTTGLLRVDGSGVTQPISGTITTTPPANATTNVTQFGGTNVSTGTGAGGAGIPRVTVSNDSTVGLVAGSAVIGHVIADSGSTTAVTGTVTVSGTVTANAGTNLNTSSLQLDATGASLNLSQASTTSGQTGPLAQTATTTSAPTYVTGKTNPLSTTTTGLLRVDGSGATQPVSGTVTANAGTNLNTSSLALDATLTGRTAKSQITDGTRDGTVKASSTLPALTDTAVVTTQRDPLPAGTNVIGHFIADTNSTTAVTGNVTVIQGTGTNLHTVVDSAPTTAVTNAGLTNIDVLLSSRTKPADQQHSIIDSGTTTVTQGTGTNLHVVSDSGSTVSVSALPVGHNIIDSGTTTVTQGTGSNLHAVLDTGSTTTVTGNVAITAASLPLPTGAAQDSTITGGSAKTQIVDSNGSFLGSTNLPIRVAMNTTAPRIGVAGIPSQDVLTVQGSPFGKPIPVNASISNSVLPVSFASNSLVQGIISSANTPIQISVPPGSGTIGLQITGTWSGQINFEGSNDGLNWVPIPTGSVTSSQADGLFFFVAGGITLIRVNSYSWDSGSAGIFFNGSVGSGTTTITSSIPSGSNKIGSVTVVGGSMVNIQTANFLLQPCNKVRTTNCR